MNKTRALAALAALVFVLPLGGCLQGLPAFNTGYRPLDSDVAEMAAPAGPAKPLHCLVDKGTAHFPTGWYGFDKSSFDIAMGQRVQVFLPRARSLDRISLVADFDTEGQKMLLCPYSSELQGARVECASLYALEEDWQHGLRRTLDVPDTVRGGEIKCSYDAAFLKK